jgi:hypothetical protein
LLSKNKDPMEHKSCISYQCFCRLRPSHILKKKYIALMACDRCTEFNWLRDSVDRTLRKNHKCSHNDGCFICNLINCTNYDLLNGSCCDTMDDSNLPFVDCAYNKCDECIYNKYCWYNNVLIIDNTLFRCHWVISTISVFCGWCIRNYRIVTDVWLF